MEWHFHDNPSVTIGLALAAGMLGQALSVHLRVPGIVLLILVGVFLGPDGADLVHPDSLGDGLPALVGIAVAIILFEGGLSLDVRRLRREGRAIRQLVTLGALTSLGVGALLAAKVLDWEWRHSLLFGTLVIVTGPTVVTPLLRRLSVKKTVETVLEAEGVLIDAVGAICAVVALELVLQPSEESWMLALPNVAARLAFGGVMGFGGGAVLGLLLSQRDMIPEGMENPFALGWAVFIFALSNAMWHESGIAAVTVAGIVVGNTRTHALRELVEFKEQLTIILIGMLFVLLVADVRLADVYALGWPGAIVAAAAVFVLRPLSVLVGTVGTDLSAKEKAFIAWIGPRGIVAAAVASFFAYELADAGIEGGLQLRAMVFSVIASTVAWSALTGGIGARLLGMKRASDDGWLVLGGNTVAVALARTLKAAGSTVIAVDQDPTHVRAHEESGVRALQGNALAETTMTLARLDERLGAVAVTENDGVNFLFAQKNRAIQRGLRYAVALRDHRVGVTRPMVVEAGAEWLFAADADLHRWGRRLEQGESEIRWYGWARRPKRRDRLDLLAGEPIERGYLPLVHARKKKIEPVTDRTRVRRGSRLALIVHLPKVGEVDAVLSAAGFEPIDAPVADEPDAAPYRDASSVSAPSSS